AEYFLKLMVVGQRPRVENDTDTIPGVLPLAILMRPVGAKQQGLSALYLGFQPPNALTHPSFSGWLFSLPFQEYSIGRISYNAIKYFGILYGAWR
ncbi:hypothetical protein QUF61_02850, partial [Candidatus Venteria ishoeyi]|uniref:hypothetical protein n=1 Tax=Candidatus Venteria ishoeyi TaxID=1899563 RepID=UPI0025A5802D